MLQILGLNAQAVVMALLWNFYETHEGQPGKILEKRMQNSEYRFGKKKQRTNDN